MKLFDEGDRIDLKRHRRHKRKLPWTLMLRIVFALVFIGLILFLKKFLTEKKIEDREGIELLLDGFSTEQSDSIELSL
jgi:hypothetical protein